MYSPPPSSRQQGTLTIPQTNKPQAQEAQAPSQREKAALPLTVADLPEIPPPLDPKLHHPTVVFLNEQLRQKALRLEREVRAGGDFFTPREGWEIKKQCRLAIEGQKIVVDEDRKVVVDEGGKGGVDDPIL
ncbi:MAG: hypothetical protein Q9195_004170 [Heterodermia aff. obscurata]